MDGSLRTDRATVLNRRERQRSTDSLAMVLRGNKQAAQVPEVFDQNNSDNVCATFSHQMNAAFRGPLPVPQVVGDVLNGLSMMVFVNSIADNPAH